MGKAKATIDIPGQASEVERLLYDLSRWPTLVDGFDHVAKVSDSWPERGAELTWDSRPDGRGRVIETVTEYEARVGQTTDFEDERMRGTQRIALTPAPDGTTVTIALEWTLKGNQPVKPVFDFLFVRNPMKLQASNLLARLRREVVAEAELGAG